MLDMVIVEYYTGKKRTEELIMKADSEEAMHYWAKVYLSY
jgi:hypothetical protein